MNAAELLNAEVPDEGTQVLLNEVFNLAQKFEPNILSLPPEKLEEKLDGYFLLYWVELAESLGLDPEAVKENISFIAGEKDLKVLVDKLEKSLGSSLQKYCRDQEKRNLLKKFFYSDLSEAEFSSHLKRVSSQRRKRKL